MLDTVYHLKFRQNYIHRMEVGMLRDFPVKHILQAGFAEKFYEFGSVSSPLKARFFGVHYFIGNSIEK